MMRRGLLCRSIVAGTTCGVALSGASAVQAGLLFDGSPYRSLDDSPFNPAQDDFAYEDFEDGTFDLPGITLSNGIIKGPHRFRDSVDADDGAIDGFGNGGWALKVENHIRNILIMVDEEVLDGLPTQLGFAFTDGWEGASYLIEAWNGNGDLIGETTLQLGDNSRHGGSTLEDRFIGFEDASGVRMIRMTSDTSGFEIDHIQYASVVPAPGALALLGLASVVHRRRRRR